MHPEPQASARFRLECSCGMTVFDSHGRVSVPWAEAGSLAGEHLKEQITEEVMTMMRKIPVRDILREIMKLRKKDG